MTMVEHSLGKEEDRGPLDSRADTDDSVGTSDRPLQPPNPRDDETEIKEFIRRIQDGDHQLFQKLVDRYRSQVVGIAFKMVGDSDDAKDIAQMVFVKTFYNLDRFDFSKRFSTWLYRIAVNASIDYIRKFKKHRFEEFDESSMQKDGRRPTPEQDYQLKQLREFVLRSAKKLKEKQHIAFVLKDLQGMEIEEIAQIMDMPQATVRWYLHRARKKLRSDLRRHFGELLGQLGIGGGM